MLGLLEHGAVHKRCSSSMLLPNVLALVAAGAMDAPVSPNLDMALR
jgi:hypothetical protein